MARLHNAVLAKIDAGPDYKGRTYDRFFAGRDTPRPGWFVIGWGRDKVHREIAVSKVCAWPDAPPAKYWRRNGEMRLGWRTKAEAAHYAQMLNENADASARQVPRSQRGGN